MNFHKDLLSTNTEINGACNLVILQGKVWHGGSLAHMTYNVCRAGKISFSFSGKNFSCLGAHFSVGLRWILVNVCRFTKFGMKNRSMVVVFWQKWTMQKLQFLRDIWEMTCHVKYEPHLNIMCITLKFFRQLFQKKIWKRYSYYMVIKSQIKSSYQYCSCHCYRVQAQSWN